MSESTSQSYIWVMYGPKGSPQAKGFIPSKQMVGHLLYLRVKWGQLPNQITVALDSYKASMTRWHPR